MWKELDQKYNVRRGLYVNFFKRVLDFLITLIGFIIISPVFIIVMIAFFYHLR